MSRIVTIERELNFQNFGSLQKLLYSCSSKSQTASNRSSATRCNKSPMVNLIRGQKRLKSLGCWLIVVLLQILIFIQISCQTIQASSSVPFKTSFVSSNNYPNIRRNGALLSMPNVEQIQRDQADSIISPPAFDPRAEEENYALINRQLNMLLREEQHQNQIAGDKQQQVASEKNQRETNAGTQHNQVHSYLQVLEDLVASPSVETSTGQVQLANGTSSVDSTGSNNTASAKQEPALVQATTLPPQVVNSAITTTSQPSLPTNSSSTLVPVYTTTTTSTTSIPTTASPTTTMPTTSTSTTTTTTLAPTTTTAIPTSAQGSADINGMTTNEQFDKTNNSRNDTATSTAKPAVDSVASNGPEEHIAISTTITSSSELSSSPAPEITSSSTITSAASSSPATVTIAVKSETSPPPVVETDTTTLVNSLSQTENSNSTTNLSAANINQEYSSDNKQQINGTITSNREARGREKICLLGDLNCNSYVVATVPVVDKWKSITSGNNKTTTRVVNEFVFVPAGDSSLSFEDAGYHSTRRPEVRDSTPEPTSLQAEHRTIDGEPELGEGIGSVAPADIEDVELDYIITDNEPLSGKSAAPVASVSSNSNSVSGFQQQADPRRHQTGGSQTEGSLSQSHTTSQPNFSPTTISLSQEGRNSSTNSKISTTQSPASSTTTTTTTTTTSEPTVRVSTSQSTSFSVRSSGPAVGLFNSLRQTSKGIKPQEASSTTPAPLVTTTTRRAKLTGRPNQKLMRIGEQPVPVARITTTQLPHEATTTASSAISTLSSASSTTTTTTTTTTSTPQASSTTTTKRPITFDWRRGETSGNRRPKQAKASQHKQYFNEPVGDLRRKPVANGQATSRAVGWQESADTEEKEAAEILNRYTIGSQLSRLSAAGIDTILDNSRRSTTKATFNDQRRSTTTPRSVNNQKVVDLRRRFEQPQQVSGQILRKLPQAAVEQRQLDKSGLSIGQQQHGGQHQQFDMNLSSASVEQDEHRTRDDDPSYVSKHLSRSVSAAPIDDDDSSARLAAKQELAIDQSAASSSSSMNRIQQANLNTTPAQQVTGPSSEEATDLHRAGSNSIGRANTSSMSMSMDNEQQMIAKAASNGQSQSSKRDLSDTVSASNGNSTVLGDHTFGTSGNRLAPPATTSSSTGTVHRPATPSTTVAPLGGTDEIVPMTTTTTTTTTRPTSFSSATSTTTTTTVKPDPTTRTITTTAPVSAKRALDPQVVGQTTEELLTLIAQSLPSSLEQQSNSNRQVSSLLLQDRQVRAEPKFSPLDTVNGVPAIEFVSTTTPLLIKQVMLDRTADQNPAVTKRQQVSVQAHEPTTKDVTRATDLLTLQVDTDNNRRQIGVDELDEYTGSIEDQLAKDALHYHQSAAPSSSSVTRKTNSYTAKVKYGSGLSVSATATVDTGKWQPSADESSMAQDESGQAASGDPLPGRPGIDYPIHWQVPKTSFDCRNYEQSGFYADIESDCQAYHSCHKGRGGRHTFLCPNGTLFSQELLTCDWWYNVECSTSKLYFNNEGGIGFNNNLDNRAQFGDTTTTNNSNNKATLNELSV